MSITVRQRPNKITPGFNPQWYVVTSDKTNESDFNYVIDIYQSSGNTLISDRLIRGKFPVNPLSTSGAGQFNTQKIVQNYIPNEFKYDIFGIEKQPYFEYSIRFGESYTYFWPFVDNRFFTGFTFNLGFSGVTPHYFSVGDVVEVEQFSGATFPQYDGVWTIIGVPDNQNIVIDRNIAGNTPIEGGTVVLNNRAVTTFPNLTDITRNITFNSSIDILNFNDYNYLEYLPFTGLTKGKWFTNVPQNYPVRLDNKMAFTFMTIEREMTGSSMNNKIGKFWVEVTENNGSLRYYYQELSGQTLDYVNYIGVGPFNIRFNPNLISSTGGTPNVFTENSKSYRIWLESTGGTRVTDYFTFSIYDYCGKWDNYEFYFRDRSGGWSSMNFELVQRRTVNQNRTTLKKGIGRMTGPTSYGYEYTDRGTTVINNDLNEVFTVTSNWFTENQSLYFEELMTSPEVYWNYDGNDKFIPIVLTKLSEEIKTKKNTRLIQYTLQFERSNNKMVQTGG